MPAGAATAFSDNAQPKARQMRLAIVENLANNAYTQAKVMRQLGHEVDLILDPTDRHAMSDPRWDDLDLEMPSGQLAEPELPSVALPHWIRNADRDGGRNRPARAPHALMKVAGNLRRIPGLGPAAGRAVAHAGLGGAWLAGQHAGVIDAIARYDCVIAYGMAPAWAALVDVPCVAETWGGDVTMVPFYDTGDWEGHDSLPLPGGRRVLFAQAKLQRRGYQHAGRIVLTDPRFKPYADRLGHGHKCELMGFVIDVDRYRPQPEPELREELLGGECGPILFVPSRQDWYWKGSDRLLCGFAQALSEHPEARLVCAGWGTDLERSRRLMDELGIASRVRLLPSAMSKERLRRYLCAADVVADQFTVGSYGTSALEAMSCAKPLLISIDRERFSGRLTAPPVANVSDPQEIAAVLKELFADAGKRAELGRLARAWIVASHGPALAERALDLCRAVVEERAHARRRLTAR
jgi:glycosyltransferase involved in cell wall biosynthesis